MCEEKKTDSKPSNNCEDELKELKKRLKELESELAVKEEEISEYVSHLQRLQADFENYKKQKEKQELELIKNANEKLILNLLDVYEDLERAIENRENDGDGLEVIYRKFRDTLRKEGLSEIPAEGEKFDPFLHEAVMVESHDEYDDGIIIEELSRGYRLNDRIIKHSIVKVCKKS
ncbi:nucleotide exchange factor GrpE [Methanothermobacter sp. KEPCO-1]|uniref:Protein GrpE n=1 Tax=Methanothermobacter marburgensis (strain ATCC BAA-927 / DSM 2133 / JCM 14651 / NBRC 100331 / OCM 82 / Marburg) TaxID=79929 RepID=D9PYE9_METTM|nr:MULTISPECIES: nucleotide exchange factor GrpE [Methanothermobacter]ADL59247.1 chaperone GrpE [Methanothermobacter marburgensis str. Marburg]QEF94590.1 nucleotide exchange factor GrpE [Methanothermobacter sp. KEPCO-1]WBF09747.1 nucleotide exchange factor GrpE [Methanothermobacter marburgensis]